MKRADILWYNSSTGETQVWYIYLLVFTSLLVPGKT
jgi:hypothetical protein